MLRDADLSGADLTGADVAADQLLGARSLEGATMPDGKRYESPVEDDQSPKMRPDRSTGSPNQPFRRLDWSELSGPRPASGGSVLPALQGILLRGADLAGADLRGADLQGAALDDAILTGADLRGANLMSASLRGADLAGANMKGALVTDEQLAEARSSAGATLPSGGQSQERP